MDLVGSRGLGTCDVTWASRAEEPNVRTNPEELIAATTPALTID